MTTPQQFRRNILGILNNWDNKLPNGSHVILIGLVDGSYIYPAMAERLHPLGMCFNLWKVHITIL